MSPIRAVRAAVLLLTLPLLAACAAIEVDAQQWGVFDPAGARTWAWGDVRSDVDDAPIDAARAAVERALSARGLQRVAYAAADLVLDLDFAVQSDVREQDPYFNTYSVVRYETGALTLEVRDRAGGELLWSGTGRSELRVSDVPNSPFTSNLVPTGAPREWKVERKIEEIFERWPAALVEGTAGDGGGR